MTSRHKTRLTLLIAGLGLMLLCFNAVRRPEMWANFFPEEERQLAAPVVEPEPETDGPVQLLDDEVWMLPNGADSSAAITQTVRRATYDDSNSLSNSDHGSIPATLTATLKDDVIGVRSIEKEAVFISMKQASRLPAQTLSSAPAGAYALFMDSPESARGKLWRLEGRLRRIDLVNEAENEWGIERKFDAWVSTNDSGTSLVHVLAVSITPELDRKLKASARGSTATFTHDEAPLVKFAGFFLKREAYFTNADAGLSMAPLFGAGRLNHIPPRQVGVSRASQLTPYLFWLALVIGVALLLILFSFSSSDAANAGSRTHQLTRLPASADFENVSSVSIAESLSQLEHVDHDPR